MMKNEHVPNFEGQNPIQFSHNDRDIFNAIPTLFDMKKSKQIIYL